MDNKATYVANLIAEDHLQQIAVLAKAGCKAAFDHVDTLPLGVDIGDADDTPCARLGALAMALIDIPTDK